MSYSWFGKIGPSVDLCVIEQLAYIASVLRWQFGIFEEVACSFII